jgi:8-oxo-dGTP pyrophosphatase MutT (NUDIX family)
MGTRFYTENSTGSIPDSCFWVHDFQLGASMVVVQPSSGKVLLVNNTERRTWFLPRGRKDIGETLEQCALREAYEEVRYFTFLLLLFRTFCLDKGVACHARCAGVYYVWLRCLHPCTHVCLHATSLFVPPPLPHFSPLARETTTIE